MLYKFGRGLCVAVRERVHA